MDNLCLEQISAERCQSVRSFVDNALAIHDVGLAPIPCGGADGKRPLVKWRQLKARPPRAVVSKWIATPAFLRAEVGILTGRLSGVTVIDCDEPVLLTLVLEKLGDTPLIVKTPSGGYHAWYKSSGENSSHLRDMGLAIDVKGEAGFLVCPPSKRLSGPHAGERYIFDRGSWADVTRLPTITPQALQALSEETGRSQQARFQKASNGLVPTGKRNNEVFRASLRFARCVESETELVILMEDWNNNHCDPPLPAAEVARVVRSAWQHQLGGTNWAGAGGVAISAQTWATIKDPDALHLLHFLRVAHAARGGDFAIAARAMADKGLAAPLGERRIRAATKRLVDTGFLIQRHVGGAGPRDASRYILGLDPAST